MKKILLSLSLVTVALAGKAQNCADLFISEYVEGTQSSKALEFYNPTSATINMNNYRIVRYSNGSASGSDSTDLVGSISSYSTFVISYGATGTAGPCDPALQALAQQLDHDYPNPLSMNGNDALVLVKKSPYARLDIFGEIGFDPGTAWSDGTGKWWTSNHSLQRKSVVQKGVIVNPSPFNVTLEWDSLSVNNWTNVGIHECSCKPVGINEYSSPIFLKVFPNPSNGSEIAFVSDKEIKSISIVSALGQTVLNYVVPVSDKKVVLKNTELVKGIYYAEIKTASGNKTEKLSIQ